MKNLFKFIIARLQEKTTWGILFSIVAGFGAGNFITEYQNQLETLGLAIAAFIGAISNEKPVKS